MNSSTNNFLESLRKNWFLVVFVGGIIVAWTSLNNRVDTVSASQIDQKADIGKLQSDTIELKGAVIESKANFIFIKESLSDLRTQISK